MLGTACVGEGPAEQVALWPGDSQGHLGSVPASCCHWAHLVVGVELLVLALALPQGLPLGLQRLGQVGVLQALL